MWPTAKLIAAAKRLESFVISRAEWCISRQRSWGVPIPILYNAHGEALLDMATLSHVLSVLKEKGTDHWWSGPTEDFIPPSSKGEKLTKGTDTLDVWFDSGSSWTLIEEAALRSTEQPLADVYLEGSDQHRGWFQSSLLTRLCAANVSPYDAVITHGFMMSEDGQKMSKSAGNGVSPMEVIHGTKVISTRRHRLMFPGPSWSRCGCTPPMGRLRRLPQRRLIWPIGDGAG